MFQIKKTIPLYLLLVSSLKASTFVEKYKPTKQIDQAKELLNTAKNKTEEAKNCFVERNSKQARDERIKFNLAQKDNQKLVKALLLDKDIKESLSSLELSKFDLNKLTGIYVFALKNDLAKEEIVLNSIDEFVNLAKNKKGNRCIYDTLKALISETENMEKLDNGSVFSRIRFNDIDVKLQEMGEVEGFSNKAKYYGLKAFSNVDKFFNYTASFFTNNRFALSSFCADLFTSLASLIALGGAIGIIWQGFGAIKKTFEAVVNSSENVKEALKLVGFPAIVSALIGAIMKYYGCSGLMIFYVCFFVFSYTYRIQMFVLKTYYEEYFYENNIYIIDDFISFIIGVCSIPISLYFGVYLGKEQLGLLAFESHIIGGIFSFINYFTLLPPVFKFIDKEENRLFIQSENARLVNPLSWFQVPETPNFIQRNLGKIVMFVVVFCFIIVSFFSDGTPEGLLNYGKKLYGKGASSLNLSYLNNAEISTETLPSSPLNEDLGQSSPSILAESKPKLEPNNSGSNQKKNL